MLTMTDIGGRGVPPIFGWHDLLTAPNWGAVLKKSLVLLDHVQIGLWRCISSIYLMLCCTTETTETAYLSGTLPLSADQLRVPNNWRLMKTQTYCKNVAVALLRCSKCQELYTNMISCRKVLPNPSGVALFPWVLTIWECPTIDIWWRHRRIVRMLLKLYSDVLNVKNFTPIWFHITKNYPKNA